MCHIHIKCVCFVLKRSGERPNKDFKTTRSIDEVGEKFKHFINNDVNIKVYSVFSLLDKLGKIVLNPFPTVPPATILMGQSFMA